MATRLASEAEVDAAPLPEATVLHVITRYLTGGSERRLSDVVAATPELRHLVVVGAEHDRARIERDLAGVAVEVLPSLVRAPNACQDARAYCWLRRRLRASTIDLLHSHQSKAGALGRLAARRHHLPAIHSLSMANFGPGFGRLSGPGYRSVEQLLAPTTAGYAVVGHDLRRRYIAAGVAPDKLVVVRSSIDLGAFRDGPEPAAAARALGIDRGAGVIAYVGRFERLKGVEDLPELLRRLGRCRGRLPTLVLAGDGRLRASVVAGCVAVAGAERVVDLGYCDRVPEVLAAADVVVLLSRCEGVPQVLVQALSMGTPFVSFAADGSGELASRPGAEPCRVVSIGDLDGVAAAVAERLDHPVPVRAELGEWSVSAVHAAHRRLYRSILASPARRS